MLDARAASGGSRVDLRFLVGETTDVEAYLRSVTRATFRVTPTFFRCTVATYGGAPLSWNHSKIIEIDGRELCGRRTPLAGPDEYNVPSPVQDMSMHVFGSVAAAAKSYIDYLWGYAITHGTPAALPVAPAPQVAAPASGLATGSSLIRTVPIIDVATSGGIAINPFTDIAGDNAIFALIDEAQSTIRLAEPSLDSLYLSVGGIGIPQHPSTRLVDHLVAAMLRGVDVYLIISETNWWNGVSAVDTAAQIRTIGNARSPRCFTTRQLPFLDLPR